MDQEHDCLPPLEHTSSGVLLADAIQRLTESLQKMFPAPDEAFEELGRLALSPRGYRKTVRWDEKNRRRQLKGLPEKPCPYYDHLLQISLANWRKKENDKSRDDEKAVKWNGFD